MKILLIIPTHNYKFQYPNVLSVTDFPSGFAYISAALKEAGHEVLGLNLNNIAGYATAYDMIKAHITKTLDDFKPDMVGTGGLCIDYKFLKDAIGIIREHSKVPIVLGGNIVTNDPEFIMDTLKPDVCIKGEGEEPFVDLADAFMGDHWVTGHLNLIKNIGHWGNSNIVFTQEDFYYKPIDELPLPDYDAFDITEMVEKYSMFNRTLYRYSRLKPVPFILVSARGCPFKCSFCKVHPEGYRPRSIENIMDEIALHYEKYHFNILIMQDELFAVNNKRMREFCETLIEKKKEHGWDFDWMMQTHANARLDLDTLRLAKASGMYMFSYGLENVSPVVLKSMRKKTNVQQIIDMIAMANEVRVGFGGNILIGDIAETEDTIRENINFFFKYGIDNLIFPTQVVPYPGSELFAHCENIGLIKDKLEYYETLGEVSYIMSEINPHIYSKWMKFLAELDGFSHLLVKQTECISVEKTDSDLPRLFNVTADCPHCGERCVYPFLKPNKIEGDYFVPACQHCHLRLRINLWEE